MRGVYTVLGAAVLLTACQTPAPATAAAGGACALTVYYGSFAMGIDHDVETAINAYVAAHRDITAEKGTRRGREGEYTLCIRTTAARTQQVYRDIAALVPKASEKAPTTVTLGGTLEPAT